MFVIHYLSTLMFQYLNIIENRNRFILKLKDSSLLSVEDNETPSPS